MKNNLYGKKLLFLGGMRTLCDYVLRARELGIITYVADYNITSPAKEVADNAVLLDATNVSDIVNFCKNEGINGITSGFVDILLEPWYKSCEILELPCYLNSELIKLSTNKKYFKEACSTHNIPVPGDIKIDKNDSLEQIKYPVFIKPADASGSRGAAICNNKGEFDYIYEHATSFSKTGGVVVEECLTGVEFLVDYYIVDGKAHLLSMFDRIMSKSRGEAVNYSDLCIAPSIGLKEFKRNIHSKIVELLREKDVKNGIIFFQGFIGKDGRIKLYEMGCRLGGTFYSVDKACVGVNPLDLLLNHALTGRMIEDETAKSFDTEFGSIGGVVNLLAKQSDEKINNILGIEEVLSNSCIVHYIQRMFEGDCYVNGMDNPVISFYFSARNVQEYINIIKDIYTKIKVLNDKGENLLIEQCDLSEIRERYTV